MYKRNLSLILAFVFLINFCSPLVSLGRDFTKNEFKTLSMKNENLKPYVDVLEETLLNPSKYLLNSCIIDGINIITYNTSNKNIKISSTNGKFQILNI